MPTTVREAEYNNNKIPSGRRLYCVDYMNRSFGARLPSLRVGHGWYYTYFHQNSTRWLRGEVTPLLSPSSITQGDNIFFRACDGCWFSRSRDRRGSKGKPTLSFRQQRCRVSFSSSQRNMELHRQKRPLVQVIIFV